MNQAQSSIAQTREDIRKQISETQATLEKYKVMYQEKVSEFNQKVIQQVKEHFSESQYEIINETSEANFVDEKREYQQEVPKLKFKYMPSDSKTQYKQAFGLKIPVDYEWKVKQKPKEERMKIY